MYIYVHVSTVSSSTPPARARTPSAGRSRKRQLETTADSDVVINPFAFNALSRMLASQDTWRKSPCPSSIDLKTLNSAGNDGIMMLLLSIEDEFDRYG